jgi:hypothetical protein
MGGTEFACGTASGRAIAISLVGTTAFFIRNAIPLITRSATSAAAAGINHRDRASQSHPLAVFFSASLAVSAEPTRAIAASCSRQCEQREKCKS